MNSVAITLHVIAATIWIGGMFFVLVVLRPSVQTIDAPMRLPLMSVVFRKFFPWVWMCIVILLLTGYWLVTAMGGFAVAATHVHIMHLLAWVMAGLFAFLYFKPNKTFHRAVAESNKELALQSLARVRQIVIVNFALGLALVAVVTGSRFS